MKLIALTFLLLLTLGACSSDSGASNRQSPPPLGNDDETWGVVYNGPAPTTEDIARFKSELWEHTALSTRCGACHNAGGQSPLFVRTDDINLAYSAVNPLVNLNDPGASRLVEKVAGGHNCWAGNNAFCAEKMAEWIGNWANAAGADTTTIDMQPPAFQAVGPSLAFPDSADDFAIFVHPLLLEYCADCHRLDAKESPQQPYFAAQDPAVAYAAAASKILLNVVAEGEGYRVDAGGSRLVVRLSEESHNCWSNCQDNAADMQAALEQMAADFELRQQDTNLLVSGALRIADGTAISQGGRIESNAIAIYPFKAGSGDTAFDYADKFPPALDLKLSGDYDWLSNWGVRFNGGRAQGSVASSAKLKRYIGQTGQYSVEAWVIPANTSQEGPARIVSYSAGDNERNFMLGQSLYSYDFANRGGSSDENGLPLLTTPAAAEVLQATQQHVVASYDTVNGRSLFVNGERVDVADSAGGGLLNEWDESFALVLGNETSGQYPWQGAIRFLAIHNRVLTPEQVRTNFEVGVGQKLLLAFDVSAHIPDMNDAYIVFQVEQFDDYSYLFSAPYFFSFTETPKTPIAIDGLYIGINGREAEAGQSFGRLRTTIAPGDYRAEGVPLSNLGAVIAAEQGPERDQFFLSFNRIGSASRERVPVAPPPAGEVEPLPPAPAAGLRTFAAIRASLAAMTGLSPNRSDLAELYARLEQQLPAVPDPQTFVTAQQMGITQLVVKYCNVLATEPAERSRFYPAYSPGNLSPTGRSAVIEPLLDALLAGANAGGVPLADSAEPAVTRAELDQLLVDIGGNCGASCNAASAAKALTSACAAAMGSALMLIH